MLTNQTDTIPMLENIITASLYLSEVQKLNQFIPEYSIRVAMKKFELTDTDARKIRDIIQNP